MRTVVRRDLGLAVSALGLVDGRVADERRANTRLRVAAATAGATTGALVTTRATALARARSGARGARATTLGALLARGLALALRRGSRRRLRAILALSESASNSDNKERKDSVELHYDEGCCW